VPSHKCHERIGKLMGLKESALRDANRLIDMPDEWLSKHGLLEYVGLIGHDDDRKYAMNIVRGILKSIYGDEGVLAADLHYVVDYIERLLNPDMAKQIAKMALSSAFFPPGRHGFVHKYRREWRPSPAFGFLPITAYCNMCKGRMRPLNAPPFCNECRARSVNEEGVEAHKRVLQEREHMLRMLVNKIVEREICKEVADFVYVNFEEIVKMIAEDVEERRAQQPTA